MPRLCQRGKQASEHASSTKGVARRCPRPSPWRHASRPLHVVDLSSTFFTIGTAKRSPRIPSAPRPRVRVVDLSSTSLAIWAAQRSPVSPNATRLRAVTPSRARNVCVLAGLAIRLPFASPLQSAPASRLRTEMVASPASPLPSKRRPAASGLRAIVAPGHSRASPRAASCARATATASPGSSARGSPVNCALRSASAPRARPPW